MRAFLVVLALVVFAIVGVVLAFEVEWELLREDGVEVAVFAASAIGLGLLAGRWKVLAAAVLPALAFLAAELRPTQERGVLIAFDAVAAALAAALCLLLGVAVAKLLGRSGRSGRSGRTEGTARTDYTTGTDYTARPARRARGVGAGVAAALGALLVAAAAASIAYATYREYRFVDEQPERPLTVDERKASFRGVKVGDPVRRARKVFGPGQRGPSFSEPLGVDDSDLSTPIVMPEVDPATLRYRELVVYVARGKVVGFTTTDPDAETKAGAGVGDSLRVAERVYRSVECDTATYSGDETTPAYPYCAGRLDDGAYLWLGGNPIDNITVLEDRELASEYAPLKRAARSR